MTATLPANTEKSGHGNQGRGSSVASMVMGRGGVVVVWIALAVIFCVLRPDTFATVGTFQNIFGSQAVLLILTLGLVISLTVGEIDLSITGVMSLSLVLIGYLNVLHGWPIGWAILLVISVGIVVGLVNAFLVVRVGVESIVVTLGMGTLLSGLAVAISVSTVSGISETLVSAVRTQVLGLPLGFWYGVVLCLAVWYLLTLTPIGRYMHFVRVGPDVLRLSGVNVNRIRFGALMSTSIVSAIAGVVMAGTLGAADSQLSASFLLPAFSAAFLGSTVIVPGRFNALGTFVGVYFLVTGITGLELLGLTGWVSDVFYGGSLVVAVTASTLASRYQNRRGARAAEAAKS